MSAKLLPCPFCGPRQSQISTWFDDMSQRWRVGCGRCGASSGTTKKERDAIAGWNTRNPDNETLKHALETLATNAEINGQHVISHDFRHVIGHLRRNMESIS